MTAVVYIAPPKPTSPIQEGCDEDLSVQASVFPDEVSVYLIFLKKFTSDFYVTETIA